MIEQMIIAGIGGFVGSGCRYLTGVAAKKMFNTSFPAGTFTANVLGCFIIGLLFGLYAQKEMSPMVDALLISGFCGGFTTFSSFSHDGYALLKKGAIGMYALYVISSVCLGLGGVWLGMKVVGY